MSREESQRHTRTCCMGTSRAGQGDWLLLRCLRGYLWSRRCLRGDFHHLIYSFQKSEWCVQWGGVGGNGSKKNHRDTHPSKWRESYFYPCEEWPGRGQSVLLI